MKRDNLRRFLFAAGPLNESAVAVGGVPQGIVGKVRVSFCRGGLSMPQQPAYQF